MAKHLVPWAIALIFKKLHIEYTGTCRLELEEQNLT